MRLVQTAVAVPPAAVPTSAVAADAADAAAGTGRKRGRHVRVWLGEDEEQHEEDSSPAVPAEGTGTLRFVNRVSVAEPRNSGKGAVDAES